jgi:hypothetical protein
MRCRGRPKNAQGRGRVHRLGGGPVGHRRHPAILPEAIGEVDEARLADSSTGADLERLVEDGKALYAYDRSRGLPLRPATGYFSEAVQAVRENKKSSEAAEGRARSFVTPAAAFASLMRG